MSLRNFERSITVEARGVFRNSKIRLKDLLEWSTTPIDTLEGEVTEHLPGNAVYVVHKKEIDKRPQPDS